MRIYPAFGRILPRIWVGFLCLCIAVLPGCHLLSPEQKDAAFQTIQAEHQAGRITTAQRDAAVEALNSEGGVDWDALLMVGGSVLVSVLTGVPIAVGAVQKKRGPTEAQRRAMAAKPS